MSEEKKLISLGDLSREKKYSKSKLTYYASMGLIVPIEVVGKMQIYDKDETEGRLKEIEKYRKQSLSLRQIKEIFDKE
jgi:DNA-binding transcriptional MerR regulator